MSVSRVQRSSLVDDAVGRIRGLIQQQGWTAGDRLWTEAELMERLQVSRSVLREAINRLQMIGLVEVRRGLGMFVGDPDGLAACVKLVCTAMAVSPRDLAQFVEFRTAVESYAVRKAAERADEGQIAELDDLCNRMDRQEESYEEAIRSDLAFHLKLIEITGNPLMLQVMRVLQEFFLSGMARTTPRPRDREVSRHLHRSILEAVRLHNPDAAEKAMQAHMEITRARLTTCIKRETGANLPPTQENAAKEGPLGQ